MNKLYTQNKLTLSVILFIFIAQQSLAQNVLQNSANDAYAITRMMDRFHVQPRAVNDTFSENIYNAVIKRLDYRKIFFTKEDIATLNPYKYQLDKEILSSNPKFLQLLAGIYRQRIKQTDSLIDEIGKKPFNYSLKEKITVEEDTSYADNINALRLKLFKVIKLTTGHSIAEDYPKKAATIHCLFFIHLSNKFCKPTFIFWKKPFSSEWCLSSLSCVSTCTTSFSSNAIPACA